MKVKPNAKNPVVYIKICKDGATIIKFKKGGVLIKPRIGK